MSNVLEHEQTAASPRAGATWVAGQPHRRGDAACDRATVTRLPARGGAGRCAVAGVRAKGRQKPAISPEVSTDSPANPAISPRVVSTDSAPTRAPQASACEPHRERIDAALRRGRNAMAIWQDLVDDVGFTARYASVRRFVRQLRGAPRRRRRASSSPPTPGEEAQVDYGEGPMVRHPQTGKYRRTRLFVLTLAHSRKAVRLLTGSRARRRGPSSTSARFGASAARRAIVVLDNLKEGVLTPDVYEPTLNPLYRDVLAHYGVVGAAVSRRRSRSQGQGRIRASATRRRRRCTASASRRLEQAQAYLDRWEAHWADTRIHGTTKRQVAAMFAEERPSAAAAAGRAVSLLPLRRAHRASRWLRRSRGRVLLDAARLDRPARPGAVDRPPRPPARSEDRPAAARARPRAARLASHRRSGSAGAHAGGRRSRSSRARAMPARISTRSAPTSTTTRAPPACAASSASSRSPRSTGPPRPTRPPKRRSSSRSRPIASCAAISSAGPPAPLTLKQVDPLIRQLTLYRDLIDQQTGDPT